MQIRRLECNVVGKSRYSFQRNGTETTGNERQNDRYAAIGAKYDNGPFSAALVVDSVLHNYASKNDKDSLGVTLGASYDFEVVKLFAMGQYGTHETQMGFKSADGAAAFNKALTAAAAEFDNIKDFTSTTSVTKDQGWKGYTASLGATAPVLGGTVYAQVNYLDAETNSAVEGEVSGSAKLNGATAATKFGPVEGEMEKMEAKNWGIAVGYAYPFSKRTNIYTYASYNQLKLTATLYGESADVKNKVTEVGFGLKHSF